MKRNLAILYHCRVLFIKTKVHARQLVSTFQLRVVLFMRRAMQPVKDSCKQDNVACERVLQDIVHILKPALNKIIKL